LQPSNALVMVALDQGYFADEGLKVSVKNYPSGTRALSDGMFSGKVDLVTASDVPVVLNSFERQDFSIIATIFKVENLNRIAARADRGVATPVDLKGKRIATQRGSAVHFFLHLFLLENGISEQDIDVSFMKAGELPEALARGDIDAFSMREPYIGQARALLGNNAVVFAAPGLYVQTDQVVIANDFMSERPDAATKILRALVKAEKLVAGNPEKSKAIVARFLDVSAAEIAAIWPELDPRVSLEQSLLLRLEDIGRWAMRRHLVNNSQMPNFLDLIHFDALQTVKPVVITVVR
jgi:NitT/TauT family transport system substrate-binding protein